MLDIPLILALLQLAAPVLGEGPHYPNEPLDMSLCLSLYLGAGHRGLLVSPAVRGEVLRVREWLKTVLNARRRTIRGLVT